MVHRGIEMSCNSKKVRFHTLGCKLNFSESSTLARQFEEGGFVRTESDADADIFVVNSCSVTAHADKKCRSLVHKLHRMRPGAIIAVTGCYAQLKPQEVASIEGVDLVFGNNYKGELYEKVAALASKKERAAVFSCDTEQLTGFFAAFSSGDRTRAFLKVQDGCDYKCAYCTIPYARGGSRNIPIFQAVDEARQIAAAGQQEIVITGINTGDFGRTTGERFIDLLRALDAVEGIKRYRISSIEPNLLTDEVIGFTAESEKFQPHFHIPLQSGCDAVLARMRRRYTTARFADRIRAVRRAMPDAFVGIDVIVGFPGESDDDFQTTYRFLEEIAPAYLHIFPYSIRPGTPAAGFEGKVPPQVMAERAERLGQLCIRLHRDFSLRHMGHQATVLFESTCKKGMMSGFTENYLKVSVPYQKALVNKLCRVSLDVLDEEGNIQGTLLD